MNGSSARLELEEEFWPRKETASPLPVVWSPPPGLAGVREQAQREPGKRFIALMHYIDVDLLQFAYHRLKEEGVRGGRGQTWAEYGSDLRANAVRLYTRLQRGRHRTLPSWRCAVAVAQGQRQPLKRAALKDRIVQRAAAEVLHAVYQADFLEFAGQADAVRGQSDALERLTLQIEEAQALPRWVVEARIAGLGAYISSKALLRNLEPRIGDERLLDLICDWLQAGILEDEAALGDGAAAPCSAIAALLTHIYCHHAFDQWAARWRERHTRNTVVLVRDAERLVAAFQYEPGARRFHTELRTRIKQFAPGLAAQDVRLSRFNCYASECLYPQYPL